jgi:hypothetical protein
MIQKMLRLQKYRIRREQVKQQHNLKRIIWVFKIYGIPTFRAGTIIRY